MRIAMVNTRMVGVNTFLVRDLRALLAEGVVLDLYLFHDDGLDPALRSEIEASGGGVHRIPFPGGARAVLAFLQHCATQPVKVLSSLGIGLWTLAGSPAEGARTLVVLPAALLAGARMKREGVDQVHGMWAGVPGSAAYWIHRHHGIPMSLSGHAWDVTDRTRLLARKVGASKGMVVCSSFAERTVAAAIGGSARLSVVHHGLNLTEWSLREEERPADPPLLLGVGRLTRKKGFAYFIEACALLRDRGRPFTAEIIGPDGGQEALLRKLIDERGLADRVRLAGSMPLAAVMERMARALVFVMSSIQPESGSSDGIPNVVLEAMALGTPVVASRAGGLEEVVRDGETGRLVEDRDPRALADAIEETLASADARRERVRNARALIEEQFDASRSGAEFLRAIGVSHPAADPAVQDERRHPLAVAHPAS